MKKGSLLIVLLAGSFCAQAQTRVVLLEQFSNSGCPPCAVSTPPILEYVDNNPNKIAAIAYHTAYPYLDSMYYENPVESDARVDFYGSFGVPYSILDGNYYRNNSANLLNVLSNTVNARGQTAAKYTILSKQLSVQNNTLIGSLDFQSLTNDNSTEALRAFVVVVEKRVEKSSYKASPGKNSENFYSYVMRKFMTDVNGYELEIKNTESKENISFSWNIQNFKDLQELRVIAFVQNIDTKEIYQSIQFNPYETATGIGVKNNEPTFGLYPNPSAGEVLVEHYTEEAFEIRIYNALGSLIRRETSTEALHKISGLEKGMYFLQVNVEGNIQTQKLLVR